MARMPRVVALGVPHHVTQRGNARQFILSTDQEKAVYLNLLGENLALHELSLLGYCLMSNHVHLMVEPRCAGALAAALRQTHGRFAAYWNAVQHSSGHVWQGRYYSCPLDTTHLWRALRYVELNPVRAGLVRRAEEWRWSSAATHCGGEQSVLPLDRQRWQSYWGVPQWQEYLAAGEPESDRIAIRQCTHTGRPFGDAAFVESLEQTMQRRIRPRKRGRVARAQKEPEPSLAFEI